MLINKATVLVKQASLVIEKIANPIFAKYNLSASQYKILKYIYSQDSRTARISDLENEFSMTHPTVLELINKLQKKGFVKRVTNLNDRRGKLVALTKKADIMQKDLEAIGNKVEKIATKDLTNTEKKELIRILKKVVYS